MLRITFPYLAFISMTALAGAVLNSFRQFRAAGVHRRCCTTWRMIAGDAVAGAAISRCRPCALAWGVFAAGILQLLLLWPALARLGLRPRLRWVADHPGVRKVFKLMLPTIFSSSVAQLNLLVGTMFASFLVAGSADLAVLLAIA